MPVSFSDLALALAALGLLGAIAGALRVLTASINIDALTGVLLRCHGSGDLRRMRRLCDAAGSAVPGAVGVSAVCRHCERVQPPQGEGEGQGGGYRTGAGDPRAAARREIEQVYREAAGPPLRRAEWTLLLQGVAGASQVGATLLWSPLVQHPRVEWWYAILQGASLLVLIGAGRSWLGVKEGTERLLTALAGPLTEAWLAGKFSQDQGSQGDDPGPPPSGPSGMLVFDVQAPGQQARRIQVPRASILKIGRQQSSHVQIEHPSVARLHAVLEAEESGLTLIDLGSKEGTLLNGESVVKATLRPGDTLRLGEVMVTLASSG